MEKGIEIMGVLSAVLFVMCMAVVGLSALVGAACVGDWVGEFWTRHGGDVGGARAVARAVRLRVTWWGRERRSAVRVALIPLRVDVRRRWGYLRGAAVLFAVCVPVWMTRYQVWAKLDGFTNGFTSQVRYMVVANVAAVRR